MKNNGFKLEGDRFGSADWVFRAMTVLERLWGQTAQRSDSKKKGWS